jgi:hypothetical protein
MTELLTELLKAGLIENLNGDDERLEKMAKAAKTVAKNLCEHAPKLIRAILAGLDPDIPSDDPAIVESEVALVAEWKSMRSVYSSTPVNLLRAILLEACNQAATEGNNAAILWLTAANTLPFLRLGKEDPILRQMLDAWAMRMEELSLVNHIMPLNQAEQVAFNIPEPAELIMPDPKEVDRANLLKRVLATAGPNDQQGQPIASSNPHWSNQPQSWSHEFSTRMSTLLADELDSLASDVNTFQAEANQQIQVFQNELIERVNKAMNSQLRWVQENRQAEQIRVNALWWSEALYSPSLRDSYRELAPPLAAVVMVIDLLDGVAKPSPASVGYLLAEAVNRLPEAGFKQKVTLPDFLNSLYENHAELPKTWLDALTPPPEEGRLSLRDLILLVLTGKQHDIDATILRIGACDNIKMSLPEFAHALFRQEQAVQLAGMVQ